METADALPAVLAVVVVVSGCSALPGGGGTDTHRETGFAVPVGGDLDFDATTVYRQVLQLQGKNLTGQMQRTVQVEHEPNRTGIEYRPSRFERVWDIGRSAPNATVAAHSTWRLGGGDLNTAVVEETVAQKRWVAHELAETSLATYPSVGREIPKTSEGDMLETAVREGTAAYIATVYVETYLDRQTDRQTWAAVRANLTTAGALAIAPIYFGERYVEEQVDSPEATRRVLDSPPWTTEQLIHGLSPDGEEPMALSVDLASDTGWQRNDSWGRYLPEERPERMGELFVRVLLEEHVDADRAATAATGWGDDRLVRLERRDTVGYAWVLRWDSRRDAEEFESAMIAYLSRAGSDVDVGWQMNGSTFDVRRASSDTVVVFVGPRGFVSGANARADGGDVSIAVGKRDG